MAVRPGRLHPVGARFAAVRPRALREHSADAGERLGGAASVRDGPDAFDNAFGDYGAGFTVFAVLARISGIGVLRGAADGLGLRR